jgi:predicted amidohydrolase YtcJ
LLSSIFSCYSEIVTETLIFLDCNFRTPPNWEREFASIVTSDGKLTYIGEKKGAQAYATGNTTIIELPEHGVLYPGFVDAHVHIYGTGERNLRPRLEGLTSQEAIKEKLRSMIGQARENDWIIVRGWDQQLWQEQLMPSAADLDDLGDTNPIALTRIDGHALWCNNKALEIAGITRGTHDPHGGSISRDEHGDPTGILLDEAMKFVELLLPSEDEDERERMLLAGLSAFAEHGHSAIHDMGVSAEVWDAFQSLYKKSGDALPHAWVFLDMHKHSARVRFLELAHAGRMPHTTHPHLHFAGVKIYLDGALGSRGAQMLEDYSDDAGNRGLQLSDDHETIELMKLAANFGLQIAVHAIGDAANARALHLFEQSGAGHNGATLRIEHAQIVRHSDLKRFEHLGVHAVVQPAFFESDRAWAPDRIGERMADAYRWASFARHGVNLVGSSDSPIESCDALHGMDLFARRCGVHDSEQLSVPDAMNAYMVNVHQITHERDSKGALEIGRDADLTVVLERTLEAPAKVLGTMVSGRWIYCADELRATL